MKTSPKTPLALLAILALGGSLSGSLFAESLRTHPIETIGRAGAFFPDRQFQSPAQQATFTPNESKPDDETGLSATPIEAPALTLAPAIETQVRTMRSPEAIPSQSPSPKPSETPQPLITPEDATSPTPEASPEVSASQTPEPEFLEQISTPE